MIAPGSVATIVSISRACDRAAPSCMDAIAARTAATRGAPQSASGVGAGVSCRRVDSAPSASCIAGDGDLGAGVAHQLLRVDVDADQSTVDREAAVERDVVISFAQLGADGEHHVGIADRRTGGRQRLGRADQQRVAGRQQPLRVDRQRDRRVQAFGEFAQFRRRVDRAAAGEDQRPARVREQAAAAASAFASGAGRAGSAGGRRTARAPASRSRRAESRYARAAAARWRRPRRRARGPAAGRPRRAACARTR